MSRLYEALRRAGEGEVSAPALEVLNGTAPVFMPTQAPAVRCPSCGAPYEELRRSLFTRVLNLLRIPGNKCAECGCRFNDLQGEAIHVASRGWGATFLPPADGRTFQECMRSLDRDEHEQHARQGASASAGDLQALVERERTESPATPIRSTGRRG